MKYTLVLAGLLVWGCGPSSQTVRIDLPLPPKLDLSNYDAVYFPGFITDVENEKLDAEVETINFFKREFKRQKVLDVVTAAPVDFGNRDPREFFKRTQPYFKSFNFSDKDNTLAVTGVVGFEVLDRSGFREVEGTDPLGRRFYRTQFVEITGFNLNIRLYVYDLETGKLLYRELLRDTADVEGTNVDYKLVYYDLMQRISDRVLGLFAKTTVRAERNLL